MKLKGYQTIGKVVKYRAEDLQIGINRRASDRLQKAMTTPKELRAEAIMIADVESGRVKYARDHPYYKKTRKIPAKIRIQNIFAGRIPISTARAKAYQKKHPVKKKLILPHKKLKVKRKEGMKEAFQSLPLKRREELKQKYPSLKKWESAKLPSYKAKVKKKLVSKRLTLSKTKKVRRAF